MSNIILILGDQLTPSISSLKAGDKDRDVVVMGEVSAEAAYVGHHKKKIAFLFAAMRRFAEELRNLGWTVDYKRFDPDAPTECFTSLVSAALKAHGKDRAVLVTEPGEWRALRELQGLEDALRVEVDILDDDRFICSHQEFADWAEGRKSLRMEYFYREMRAKTGLLMDGDDPAEGRWNFDAENRKAADADVTFCAPARYDPDETTLEVLSLVGEAFADNFGVLEPFWFATSRRDAEAARARFISEALPAFGDYQDAMVAGERFLNHSVLSLYINAGLLDPLETCRMAEKAYRDGRAPINSVEGFIRQIIGWREYVRGIYWREGDDYPSRNYFKAGKDLPDYFWTGDTGMACVKAAVDQTAQEAYAHHIQRLMVTGNFAMIAGVDPAQVHEWYLAVYADAYEWVEAPNVIGMSQFADGGLLATKPYAASGAYINRMSDYCKSCRYKVSKKTEDDACPFNALYWDFLIRNEKKLKDNGRLSRVYQNWARMDDDRNAAYRARAKSILKDLDAL